jgi:hypothetical protein
MEMRRSATPLDQQMNLLLCDAIPPGVCEQQRELTLALVELLINAAQRSTQIGKEGVENESPEAHA